MWRGFGHFQAVLADREVIPEAVEQVPSTTWHRCTLQRKEFDKTIELVNEWMSLVDNPSTGANHFMAAYSRKEDCGSGRVLH